MSAERLQPITTTQEEFLRSYLPPSRQNEGGETWETENSTDQARPFVTLTYAASLDSMISLAPGIQTKLSGPESKSMTHYLRKHHQAILVGVNTAIADNPSLNCRYPPAGLDEQPCPIILDPSWRWDESDAKVVKLFHAGEGRQPTIIGVGHNSKSQSFCSSLSIDPEHSNNGHVDWTIILQTLKQRGVDSIMIEGGATIINELLSRPELVDSVIITIAPTFLGRAGVNVAPLPQTNGEGNAINAADLENIAWQQFGNDIVLCGRLKRGAGH